MKIDPTQPSPSDSSSKQTQETQEQYQQYLLLLQFLLFIQNMQNAQGQGSDSLNGRIQSIKKELSEGRISPANAAIELMQVVEDHNRNVSAQQQTLPLFHKEQSSLDLLKQQVNTYETYIHLLDQQNISQPDNLLDSFHKLHDQVASGIEDANILSKKFYDIIHAGNEYLPTSLQFPEPSTHPLS